MSGAHRSPGATSGAPLLEVHELGLRFHRSGRAPVQVLDGVSFTLDAGQTLALVGESGSGKSVTALAIAGLLDPAAEITGGSVRVGGEEVVGATPRALQALRRTQLAMVFQNPRRALNPIRRVGLQIEDALQARRPRPPREARARAIELLAQVGIAHPETRWQAYPWQLSGGMCQRVLLALALSGDPALLIADEPTTGLDVSTQADVMDLIATHARARGMATLFITHDLALAATRCEQVAVMRAGRIVEQGAVDALLHRPVHPYTQQLLAATPRPGAALSSLRSAAAPADRPVPARTQPLRGDAPLLQVRHLHKQYELPARGTGLPWRRRRLQLQAVSDLSFSLQHGEALGLVGESGSGKSTTAGLIARLADADAGEILFEGTDIARTPARRAATAPWRSRVQMVFQDPGDSLAPHQTAQEAIAQPLRRLTALCGAALEARVLEAAERVQLPRELLSHRPHQLSGGQAARVGIARAIVLQPALLILDEPTSALDVSVQVGILQLLDQLRRDTGMGYLFVSHDLQVVRLLCQRVLVMQQGRVVEHGSVEQVLDRPTHPYARQLADAVPRFPLPVAATAHSLPAFA